MILSLVVHIVYTDHSVKVGNTLRSKHFILHYVGYRPCRLRAFPLKFEFCVLIIHRLIQWNFKFENSLRSKPFTSSFMLGIDPRSVESDFTF